LGLEIHELRKQWQDQISSQTKKAERRSRHHADHAVSEILAEKELLHDDTLTVLALEKQLSDPASWDDRQTINNSIAVIHERMLACTGRIHVLERSLGVSARQELNKLKGNPYLRARMNARVLKTRLRARVIELKFERSKLEGGDAFRDGAMQTKEHTYLKAALGRKRDAIAKIIRLYNASVTEITRLIEVAKAPSVTTIPPRRIDPKDIFKLDVDDSIWQDDPGLGDIEGSIPPWLNDQNVRTGIVSMLQVDRCREERERLDHEILAMQNWLVRESERLINAFSKHSDDQNLIYLLTRRMNRLCYIERCWHQALHESMPSVSWRLASVFEFPSVLVSSPVFLTLQPFRPPCGATNNTHDASDCSVSEVSESCDDKTESRSSDESIDGEDDPLASGDHPESTVGDVEEFVNPSPTPQRSKSPEVQYIGEVYKSDVTHSSRSAPSSHPTFRIPTVREPGRVFEHLWCNSSDLARLVNRNSWLNGAVISLFALYRVSTARRRFSRRVYALPTTLMHDVDRLFYLREAEYTEASEAICQQLVIVLNRYCASPNDSASWLIPAHVPNHWVLLEIRWDQEQLRIYDSLPNRQGAAQNLEWIKKRTVFFLELLRDDFNQEIDLELWRWIYEQRGDRQTNEYDCGAFVAADIVSLAENRVPSPLRQQDMDAWRRQMLQDLRSLDVREVKPCIPSESDMVIPLDEDECVD
jgi:hypothetical protein